MSEGPLPHLSDAVIIASLLDDNPLARAAFKQALGSELPPVISACLRAFRAVEACNHHPPVDTRLDQCRLFLHAAFNHVLSSTNLLVAGFPLPSGQLMRHFGESVAMLFLCLDPASGVLERYQADPRKYPADEAVARVRRPKQWARTKRLLDATDDGWEPFVVLDRLWGQFSHAGAFALGFQFKFADSGALIIGAEFDPDKVEQFRQELRWRRSAFESLEGIADRVLSLLPGRGSPNARASTRDSE
jgi:hypothetical protein